MIAASLPSRCVLDRESEKVSRHAEWYAIKMQIVLLPKGLS